MRLFIAAATSAALLTTAAFAAEPFNGQGWQRARPPAAVAYFKMPFHAAKTEKSFIYGFALTAPMPRSYAASPTPIADAPKLADLNFDRLKPDTLYLSGEVAWSMTPSQRERQRSLLGMPGLGGVVVGLALGAGAAYGLYSVVKKECPAISTTTGGCVQPAN